MDLSKMVDERLVKFDMDASSKEDAIRKVAALMYTTGKVSDQNVYIQGVLDREKEFATGIGMHIAIPHCLGIIRWASRKLYYYVGSP